MIFYPAVDIQNGRAVRLHKGKKDQSTIFSNDPAAMARQWQDQGAEWLHIIDLDGAFAGNAKNAALIQTICQSGLPCQIGGGIRSLEDAEFYLQAGAARLIIGTLALENTALFKEMCAAFPGKIGVSLDAEAGLLKTRGWVHNTNKKAVDVLPQLEECGASFIIYTDIERDGTKSGPNISELCAICKAARLPVIAAGGISSMADIEAIAALSDYANLNGVISGRAIYDGALNLPDAVACLAKTANSQKASQ